MRYLLLTTGSAPNGKLETPAYFLKAKQGYTVRKKWKKR
jgi:hypothetical protein